MCPTKSCIGSHYVNNFFCWSTHLYEQLLFLLSLSIKLDLFFGSCNLCCVLPSPTCVPRISKMYLVCLLIDMYNFYFIVIFNSAGSNFCVLLIYIVSYKVLFRFPVCEKYVLLVYSSLWTTFISIVIVNSAGSISRVLLINNVSYLGRQYVNKLFRSYWSKCVLHGSPTANDIIFGSSYLYEQISLSLPWSIHLTEVF